MRETTPLNPFEYHFDFNEKAVRQVQIHYLVNEEFLLQSKFLSQLDHFSERLRQISQSKGGVKGQKIKSILTMKDKCNDINIRSLAIYFNEDPNSLFKEYQPSAVEDVEMDIAATVMGIYIFRRDECQEPDDVVVVIEGVKVLTNVGSAIMAFTLLFGLIYALDLSFPENSK